MAFSGYSVSIAAAALPYDLLVDDNGCIIRVQVKSSSLLSVNRGPKNAGGRPRYRFGYEFEMRRGSGESYAGLADVFAFVAPDKRLIIYEAIKNIGHNRRLPADYFTFDKQELSRQQAFKEHTNAV